ncbi:17490_t:CDS:2 [Funneliformis caledonium]|uniref:17490_t:CDS:1 n=1 Tax=Funneliformis caledonium TaxID=1117310 RepID=A0A9N9B503_9GLOM|nr:17490_t:CDS:2 [Funneliformis caledonium]
MFNYLLFIKHLEATAISSMICDGINYKSADKRYHQFILEEEIYKLFMSECSLKSLELDHIKHQIHHFPGAYRCLADLVELNTNSSIPSEIFFGLSRICKRIKKIYVYFDYIDEENYGFVKLIQVQQNLKRFVCTKSFDNNNDPSEELGLALTSCSQTLTNLESRFKREIFLPPRIFPLFRNLKILQLLNDFLSESYEEQLQVSSYPNLEILYIKNISPYTISKIINSTTGKLRKILIQYNIGDYSNCLIQSIIEHCPNVEILSLIIDMDNLLYFVKLLDSCRQLKGLLIRLSDENYKYRIDEEREKDGKRFLNALLRSSRHLFQACYSDTTISMKCVIRHDELRLYPP